MEATMSILELIAANRGPIVPLTVEQYHQMLTTGILREGDPIELIDGVLVRKDRADCGRDSMTTGSNHAVIVTLVQLALRKVEAFGFHLRSQLPVTLGNTQEPEPDVALIRGKPLDYRDQHPGPPDIAAVVEVSDSSLSFDRTTKQRVYANAAIADYWIINLVDSQIEVYQEPDSREGKYRMQTNFLHGQSVTLTLGPAMVIDIPVNEILPD
jgi:Uma2 family endonuclease